MNTVVYCSIKIIIIIYGVEIYRKNFTVRYFDTLTVT